MGRNGGFLIKHRVSTLCRRVFRHRQNSARSIRVKPLTRMIRWANKLRSRAKAILLSQNREAGREREYYYKGIGEEELIGKPEPVPKGYMAVYVGQKDGDFQRILMPVVHFNHPLFGDLLKESEKEYGFDQPGGIAIPCRISEFERVQTRIKTVQCTRKLLRWKSPTRSFMS